MYDSNRMARPMNKFLISLFCTLLFIGCTVKPPQYRVIQIDKSGEAVNPENGIVFNSEADFQKYIDSVLTTKNDTIFIYIHGGLKSTNKCNKDAAKLTETLPKNYTPVFIHWRSGFWSTYKDHLFFLRQDKYRPVAGPLTSPFILIYDLARGIVFTPLTWWYQRESYFKGVTFNPDKSHWKINIQGFGDITELTEDFDTRSGKLKFGYGIAGLLKLPWGLIAAPFLEATGSPAWDVMKLRIEVLSANREKGLDTFAQALTEYQNNNKDKKIVLVAYSMGAFIANNILSQHPDIELSKIIYLAAGCSIKDFQNAVIPYLTKHKSTKFYSYSLHPAAENLETKWFGLRGTGSLLNQIDRIYERPAKGNHRTMGKWENVMKGIHYFNDDRVKSSIFLRTMKFDDSYPTKHSHFEASKFSEYYPKVFKEMLRD
ncbi:MAG: alpha/beta hydrolase [Candidatus Cloacimonetes bacterium]|nr:alpha/beta hydrolase [Candidatus Cloacimonadota bacterium]